MTDRNRGKRKLRGVPQDGIDPKMMQIRAAVRIGEEVIPVTVSRPTRWLASLSSAQKQAVSAEAGVNFLSDEDWVEMEDALNEFAWTDRLAKDGISYEAVHARMQDYQNLAAELLEAMSIKNRTDQLAYNRIMRIAGDEVYPQVSRFVWAAVQAIASLENEARQGESSPPPFTRFVRRVAAVFTSKGVHAGKSKAKDYCAPRPSKFQKFVRALLRTLGDDAPPSLSDAPNQTAAFMQKVANAMSGPRS